jgi:tetratricopeptide (TPR) repeat protein
VAMWRYWLAHGLMAEGRRWLQDVLATNPEPTALRARALFALAVFDVRRGDASRLVELADEAVAIRRSLNDPSELAGALHSQGVLDYMRGEWEQCWQRAEEARQVGGGEDHPVAITALHLQSLVLAGRGEFVEARRLMTEVREVLASHREVEAPFFLPLALGFMVEGRSTAMPRVFFEETVLPGRAVGARQADAYVLCSMAAICRLTGDISEARGLLDEAQSRFAAYGDRDGEARAMSYLGWASRAAGDLASARSQLEASLQMRRAIGDRRAVGLTQAALGVLTCTEGDLAGGCASIDGLLGGFEETQDHAAVGGIALSLASAYTEAGDYEQAARILSLTLPKSSSMPGNHRATGWGWVQLGDLHAERERPADAARAYAEARRQFIGYGAVDGLRELDVRRSLTLQIVE